MKKNTTHQSFRKASLNAAMQRISKVACVLTFFIVFALTASAQTKNLGSITDFKSTLQAKQGSTLRGEAAGLIQTPDETYAVRVNKSGIVDGKETLVGEVAGNTGSHFIFTIVDGKLEGMLFIPLLKKAYRFYTDDHGFVQVEVFDINNLICASYEKFVETSSSSNQRVEAVPPSTSPVYKFKAWLAQPQ